MMSRSMFRRRGGPAGHRSSRPVLTLLAAGLLSTLAGCDSLLDVRDNPNEVGGDAVEGEGAFQARLIGAQSDFTTGFGQAVAWGALFTDELLWGGPTRERGDANRRDVDPDNLFIGNELWSPVQISAKSSKDLAEDIAAGNFPNQAPAAENSEAFARTALLAGYTRALLADLFCTTAFDGTGPELSQEETYQRAEEFFTRAISATEVTPQTRNAALVGRARVRLQLGDESGAIADAEQVTEGFESLIEYSSISNSLENPIFGLTWDARTRSVEPRFRSMTIDDTEVPDPRVEVFDTGGLSFNGAVQQFNPVKYASRSDPIRLASWFEAQYIIAEVEGGQVARDIINDVRARQGIETEFDPGSTASEQAILEKLLDERGRTFFIEAQRMPDLRRFRERHGIDRYPTGADFGDQVCMPLPDLERANNPDI